jgi:NADPH:quinone reductase-like Zn-dependent oxidoreductase
MRAVATTDFGRPPTIIEVATPTPRSHEIRVEVHASSLNGFDLAVANGYLNGLMDHRFPVTLGRDFAGLVDRVGADVTRFQVGDEVFGVVLTQPLHAGGFADHLVVPEDHNVAHVPAGLDLALAGRLGLAGAAAVASIDAVDPQGGETVLVSGATGGVGALTMQMCAARGVTVIATAADATEDDHVRRLGAAHTVDYRGDLAAAVRAIAPAGVDAVLHFAGDAAALAGLVTRGGRLASLLIAGVDGIGDGDVTAHAVVANPEAAVLEKLAARAAAGQLILPVQRTYPLEDVPRAFADFAAGTLGKLAVRVR